MAGARPTFSDLLIAATCLASRPKAPQSPCTQSISVPKKLVSGRLQAPRAFHLESCSVIKNSTPAPAPAQGAQIADRCGRWRLGVQRVLCTVMRRSSGREQTCACSRRQMAVTLVNSRWPRGKAVPRRLPPWRSPGSAILQFRGDLKFAA